MSTQPKALRLADALEELDRQFSRNGLCGDAAAELRRLHEVNQDLLKALHEALETKQKPAAWINWNAATGEESIDKYCDSELASVPLYRLPKNLSPLTDNQILEILPDAQHGWTTATYGKWVARAVERLHGIRGKSTKINNEITQEAVECLCGICKLDKCEWVGLTDEEIAEVISGQFAERNYWVKITKALESKLKEKNA